MPPNRQPAPPPPTPRRLSRRQLLRPPLPRPAAVAAESDSWLRVFRHAMATRFEVTLDGADAARAGAAAAALREAERLERAWSLFRDDSEITAVNRSAARAAVPVDPELFDLLARCERLHQETHGAFDITATALSRCWGFLTRQPRVPSDEALEAARRSVGQQFVRLDPASRSVRFARPGLSLNLGSIGKGAAVDRIADALGSDGVRHALVSAGGSSIRALAGGSWTIDVRPGGRPAPARVRLRDAAMGTSGAGEQFLLADGLRHGHVIDPRTGWPVRDIMSATVVCDRAADADAWATAVLIDGAAAAERCLTALGRALILLVPAEGAAQVLGYHPSAVMEML